MDVPNRDELEGKLARALGKLLKTQMGRLLELMGDPPKIENVPDDFWREQGVEFDSVLRPFLQKLFLDQAERMMRDGAVGVDWALVNDRAVRWARAYTYELVSGLNATSRQTLQRTMGNYFTESMTIGDLEDMLMGTFGPVRAEMISITEITRASARGEDALWDELQAQGIEMVTTWNTNNDELVCEICGPLNGKPADGRDNGEPYWDTAEFGRVTMPAHPRCRCFEGNELPEVVNV